MSRTYESNKSRLDAVLCRSRLSAPCFPHWASLFATFTGGVYNSFPTVTNISTRKMFDFSKNAYRQHNPYINRTHIFNNTYIKREGRDCRTSANLSRIWFPGTVSPHLCCTIFRGVRSVTLVTISPQDRRFGPSYPDCANRVRKYDNCMTKYE